MTMPDSRGRRSLRRVRREPGHRGGPGDARRAALQRAREVEHDDVRGEREGQRRDRQERRAGERHAPPAEARRDEPREQPDDRRRQRIGGQHEARARLGEMEAVGVARQQRHDRLVERRLDEHRQADRDRDAARVHDSILPARTPRRTAAARGPRQSSTMWMHIIRSFADASARAGSSRTTTLRLGAQAPLNRSRTGERPEHNPPRPACVPSLRHDCTGSTASAGRPGETDMLEAVLALLGLVVGAALAVVVHAQSRRLGRGAARRGGARAGERPPRGRRGAQGGGGRGQGAHARCPQRGRGAAQGPQPRGRPLRGAARRPRGPARSARRRRRGARESPRRARRGAGRARGTRRRSSWRSSSASSSASPR